ncbi:30S ribosomal protein S6 [Candidatus Fermentibacterales bacterium]|nr:30S ribosomal protein S6 [Candidatus Fermentibacterales bacterium]
MRTYETALIYAPSLSDPELDTGVEKLSEVVTANGGTISSTRKWGRRQLAYPISGHQEGLYVFLRWQGGEQVSQAIDRFLRLDESCIRFLSLRVGGKSPVEYELQPREEAVAADLDEEAPASRVRAAEGEPEDEDEEEPAESEDSGDDSGEEDAGNDSEDA